MKLLLDAGNSRVKWAVYEQGSCLAHGAVAHADVASLAVQWQDWPIQSAWGAAVTHPELIAQLSALAPCPVQWVSAQAQFGEVVNHYQQPATQGVDRWLAVLAARQLCRDDVIVVCAGTALTVEALSAEGHYLGGVIVPGLNLMLTSLADNTAKLRQAAGNVVTFPQNTSDALASGAIQALAGAIEKQRQHLAEHVGKTTIPVLLTGGDAAQLAPRLAEPVQIVDNLVLMGLLQVANQ